MLLNIFLLTIVASVVYGVVQQSDVKFFLTNSTTAQHEFTTADVRNLGLDATFDVKILCHGWTEDINSYWYANTTNNYLTRGKANIIKIDWSAHADDIIYPNSVAAVPHVAYFIALMIVELNDALNIPFDNVHLVGHSLGAHTFGFTGKHIFSMKEQKVGRITGLDPAGPLYLRNSKDKRLSSADAKFVDVIHTDAGGFGYLGSIGDIDFYPNGGIRIQPGCELHLGCSHQRAPLLFCESILSNGFKSFKCGNQLNFKLGLCNNNQRTVMGENVDQTATGNYYFNTARSSPYALGSPY